jgi:hypothetical protein
MFQKRVLSCALMVGLGVPLAGCAPQPTVYSGAYYAPRGPVYGGLYYVGTGTGAWAYSGGGSAAWPAGYGGVSTLPSFTGPYYAGYYWRHGYPHRRLYRWYQGGYFRGAY